MLFELKIGQIIQSDGPDSRFTTDNKSSITLYDLGGGILYPREYVCIQSMMIGTSHGSTNHARTTNVYIHFTPFNWAKAQSIRGSLMKMRAFLLID